ncbi:hypothetical protein PEL8287_01783 [Roseovarius litorisediminis]|uniref:Pre ATP-grasp domain-containing protein n=1 Tax=Roseovarius litorisediminis TaxID=1312363 RepID=A0A1Y5SCG5_9RHOB|nr:hypothetical protein [Roseovarius litorisediminis]SLN37272.1 hypothetical protein PEL8287_01783 [Roseovarius litorisediminis]
MKDCTTIIERLVADEPALLGSLDFGPFVRQGTGPGPSVLIGDQSEISLLRSAQETRLEYRMSHLARSNDIVLVRRRDTRFEDYLAGHLGLENLTFLELHGSDILPVSKQALASSALIESLAGTVSRNGGLTLKSYLTTGNIWRLAKAIGDTAQQVVHVCGPSPRVTTRSNDKLWFSQLACAVLGRDATPPTMSAYGPAAAAALVSHISKRAAQVVVKVPDSAGSAGNVRVSSTFLADKTLAETRDFLLERLHATGWRDSYPVLVGVWDDNVICTPSAQLWIPRPDEGKPIVEGIFEQTVMGEVASFAGAARASLPESVLRRLHGESKQIAAVLQHIGYYGRCSFDAVLVTGKDGRDKIHWIECNGRWGGVSIPMTAAAASGDLRSFKGLLIVQEKLKGNWIGTDELLKRLDDLLYRHASPANGIILLSPPPAIQGTVVNYMVVADTQAAARTLGDQAMNRLTSSA